MSEPRYAEVADLANQTMLAEMLGVSRQRVEQWSRQATFPEPVWGTGVDRGNMRLWSGAAVRLWNEHRQEKPGPAPHGTLSRYKTCHCDECRSANANYQRQVNALRRERLPDKFDSLPHGSVSTYDNWGCRCAACSVAKQKVNHDMHVRIQREKQERRRQELAS